MNFLRFPLFLSLLSVLLLSLPWLGGGSFWILGAFVPLLLLRDRVSGGFLWWVALTLFLWIMATCYWVSFATLIATAAVPIVGICFMWPGWVIFDLASRGTSKVLGYVLLTCGIVSMEWLYSLGDVSFPWLTLGGAFAPQPWAVQWYSITGVYGGSLWIVVANLLIYTSFQKRRVAWIASAWIAVPLIISLAMYWSYDESTTSVQVSIIQPNIDPYTEKFDGISADDQTTILLNLAASSPSSTQFYVAPETAITDYVSLEAPHTNRSVARIQQFLIDNQSGATFIVGATTVCGEVAHNSALYIDSSNVEVYHKSKLVMGVEVVPDWLLGALEAIDLGGYVGSLGRQNERTVYQGVGTAICYESIYGEYFSRWSFNGAGLVFVITNDGWWRDTPGHRQHFAQSRLRAVETRRSIGRSANTGISALIDPRGDVVESLGWDERGILTGRLTVNDTLTPYARSGDYIARLALYIYGLALLYAFALRFRRKV